MPEKKTAAPAAHAKKVGNAPRTQAGEYVKETIKNVREGRHGVRSAKQAIALGLSKARRAGVTVPPPKSGKTSLATRKKAARDTAKGKEAKEGGSTKPSVERSAATNKALKQEGGSGASKSSLFQQTKAAARKRTPVERSASARKAAATRKKHAAK